MNNVYKKNEFIYELATRMESTKKAAGEWLEGFEDVIKTIMKNEDSIKLAGFMNFFVKEIPEKERVNNFVGKSYTSPAHKIIKVKLAKDFRDCLK